jgi:hypothetical protein
VKKQRPDSSAIRPDGSIDQDQPNNSRVPHIVTAFVRCINLGRQEFFPGRGSVVYHDLAAINLV